MQVLVLTTLALHALNKDSLLVIQTFPLRKAGVAFGFLTANLRLVCTYIYMFISVYVYTGCVYVYVCIDIHIYIYMYIYIHNIPDTVQDIVCTSLFRRRFEEGLQLYVEDRSYSHACTVVTIVTLIQTLQGTL